MEPKNNVSLDSRRHIPAEALEKIEKCSECWNDEIRPHFYKAMCFGYLLAIGKLSSYHWTALDPPPGHQPTETPALGESSQKSRQCGHCGTMHYRDTEGSMPAICCNCHNPLIWPPRSVGEEAVPAQQGEVPEDVYLWVLDEAERTYDEGEHQQDFISGMTTMYRRDQHEIDCLKSEIMGLKKVYGLANQAIDAFQSQIAVYRLALEKIFQEGRQISNEALIAGSALQVYHPPVSDNPDPWAPADPQEEIAALKEGIRLLREENLRLRNEEGTSC